MARRRATAQERMEAQTGRANRTVRVSARLTPFEVGRLDVIAQLRQVSRSEALREAIAWLAAREAVWAERARQARIRRVVDESESWDPTGDALSAGALDLHEELSTAGLEAPGDGQRRAHGRPPAASRRGAPSAAAPARAPLLPATAATSSTRSNLLGAELADDQVRADQGRASSADRA